MTTSVFQRKTCRLCDSPDVRLAVKLCPVPLAEKYGETREQALSIQRFPLDLYRCDKCGHAQLLDVIDSDTLWDDYTYHSGQTQAIVDHFKEVSGRVIQTYKPQAGSLVIDIGSNDGSLLSPFREAGYRVLGIDPAKDIAARATANGIETLPTVFTSKVAKEIAERYGHASVITAFNVFAHADDLGDMAEGICSLLDREGVFLFEVQYLLDIVQKMLLGTIFHEHMSHHSVKPMMRFLNYHGMELIDVERVNIQKGSIIGTVQKLGGKRSVTSAVKDLVKLEENTGLDGPQALAPFAERLEKNKALARELKDSWREKGLAVAAYGAARSGPTLIAQYGFADVIQYMCDDHPQKVNRYSPGDGIPVVGTQALYERKPDVVIVLAWIHARAIIEKNKKFLDDGGCFVLCCPDIRIVDKSNPY